jgi:hypothetical protein
MAFLLPAAAASAAAPTAAATLGGAGITAAQAAPAFSAGLGSLAPAAGASSMMLPNVMQAAQPTMLQNIGQGMNMLQQGSNLLSSPPPQVYNPTQMSPMNMGGNSQPWMFR